MNTLNEHVDACNRGGQPTGYHGDRGHWLLALSVHRDSDSLSRSNFAVLLVRLGGESGTVAVERFGHWAVGWIDKLLVDPADAERVNIVERAMESMDGYPVLDESHWSDLEYEEFWAWAESELKRYDGWEAAVQRGLDNHNSGIGDDTAEAEIIESAREQLE